MNITSQMEPDYFNSSAQVIETQQYIGRILTIIGGVLMTATLWILLCLIVYGVRTKRWKKNGKSSSLNNGIVYVSCTVTIALFLLLQLGTVLIYFVPHYVKYDVCEILGDVKNVLIILAIGSGYLFLWLRQRIIYLHPQVKPHMSTVADFLSRFFVPCLLLVQVVTISVLLLLPNSYELSQYGCRKRKAVGLQYDDYIGIIAILSIQISLIGFTIYPAIKVDFDATGESGQSDAKSAVGCFKATEILFPFCQKWYWKSSEKHYHLNPIDTTVRRTVINCIIVIFIDIAAVATDRIVQYDNILTLQYIGYDVASVIKIFCMLATFSFSFRVLTFYCPAR